MNIKHAAIHQRAQRQLFLLKWAVEAMFIGKRHPLLRAFWIAVGIIMVWRGIWVLADTYLVPENPFVSAVISIAIGALMLIADDFRIDELK